MLRRYATMYWSMTNELIRERNRLAARVENEGEDAVCGEIQGWSDYLRYMVEPQLAYAEFNGISAHIGRMHHLSRGTVGAALQAFNDLLSRLMDLVGEYRFLFVGSALVPLYEQPRLFGDKVDTKFKKASVDIEEAGKCLALGRGTAAVFHMMRVLEIALQKVSSKIGVPLDPDRNWDPILRDMRTAIKGWSRQTSSERRKHERWSAAVGHLENVKDAWRNPTMHPRHYYSQEWASEVWEHVRLFMARLAELV